MSSSVVNLKVTYLVGLVVVLWVVLGNLWLLNVHKVLDESIDTESLSPLLALYEHLLCQWDIELSGSQKPKLFNTKESQQQVRAQNKAPHTEKTCEDAENTDSS